MEYFSINKKFNPEINPINVKIDVAMRLYSDVKLFVPKIKGRPTIEVGKRWYVYYYFLNPITLKKEKFTHTCKLNRIKTLGDRRIMGKKWVEAYTLLLNQGFNPFDKEGIVPIQLTEISYTVATALEYAYRNKIGTSKATTASDYKTRLGVFLDWAYINGLDGLDIRELKDIHIIAFMNWLVAPDGRNVGKTSQDNYKRALSVLFGKLVKDKIIIKNIVSEIETSKDDPIKNTPFTGYEVKAIRDWLLENDKQLYHFIQFVIFTFLRPREIIRLKVEDINLREKYLRVETKTKRKQIKKLIGPIVTYLESIAIENLPSEAHLFTNTRKFEVWNAIEKTKVDHFGHRFTKVKKHFGFNKDYGIYSFRHTAAMDLFTNFLKNGLTEREAILKLMPITGHATETALRNYLRDIGGMLPKDYGSDYTLEF